MGRMMHAGSRGGANRRVTQKKQKERTGGWAVGQTDALLRKNKKKEQADGQSRRHAAVGKAESVRDRD
jgi:hypothetical protein